MPMAAVNAVEMPCVSTSWPQRPGSSSVAANCAFSAGDASAMNDGNCFSTSSRLAVPKTVTRMDSPSEPPTCWLALSSPDAAPASCCATPETAVSVRVTKLSPIPKPKSTIGPSTPLRYELSGVISVCQKRPGR